MKPTINIYSSYARDTLIFEDADGHIQTRPGGPATFLVRALRAEGIGVSLNVGPTIDVTIRVKDGREEGYVDPVQKNTIPLDAVGGPIIISTIFDEWNPEELANTGADMYLDVQGFVREPSVFGKKKVWNGFRGDWTKRVICLKATERELEMLPTEMVENQKQRMLLVTQGKAGVTMYVHGKIFEIVPDRIIPVQHATGAGDTLFGTFVARILLGDQPEQAIIYAIEKTSDFLEG